VRKRVPQSIVTSTISNAIMQWAWILLILYTFGDPEVVASDTTGLPIIQVYYQATKSKAAATVFVLMPFVICLVALFNCFASVSRLTWAFAVDNGLPFPRFFSKVFGDNMISDKATYLGLGSPNSQASHQCSCSGLLRWLSALTDLHRLLNSIQRHYFSLRAGTARLLYNTHCILRLAQSHWPPCGVWTFPIGTLGAAGERARSFLPLLLHHLDPIPHHYSGPRCKHELRWTDFACRYHWRSD
jgi:hypothetical protein